MMSEKGAVAEGLSGATEERGSEARTVLTQGTPLEPRAALRRPRGSGGVPRRALRGVRGVALPGDRVQMTGSAQVQKFGRKRGEC